MSEKIVKCPKCGSEISENQKFCSNCGTKLDSIENKQNSKNILKKITISICCVILASLSAFGGVQYVQYQKDTAPITIERPHNNSEYYISYDSSKAQAHIRVTFKDAIIEQWQIDLYEKFKNRRDVLNFTLSVIDEEGNTLPPEIEFSGVNLEKGKPLSIDFIVNSQGAKDFNEFKKLITEGFNNQRGRYSMPLIFSDIKSKREQGRKMLTELQQEEERIKKEEEELKAWREKVSSNCVYKTRSGVCFTTTVFDAEGIKENAEKNDERYNYYLAAKDACESQGYRLPNDNELRFLFSDFMGVDVKGGFQIKTTKFTETTEIPNNYNVAKAIAPNGFHNYGTKWDDITLWEYESLDDTRAHIRRKNLNSLFGTDETYQDVREKMGYPWDNNPNTICVYNPNGKPYKSLLQIQKEENQKQ